MAAVVRASASSASAAVASSSSHTTQTRHPRDALALGGENHGKEKKNTPPRGSSLTLSNDDELVIPFLEPSKTTANDPEEQARQVRKWKLKHRATITGKQPSNEQVMHAAALQPGPSPSSPPPTITSWPNIPFGALKTPAPQPAADNHYYHLQSPPTHSRVLSDDDTTIFMPNLLYLTPERTVGRGRGFPPPRPSTRGLRRRTIVRPSPAQKKVRRTDEVAPISIPHWMGIRSSRGPLH
mmetsp:Transcript_16901/g.30672  ORF Transcript_16901/g.30672 Transcript_16901/m.30672 type:complete len:239 (+) Transcript_16901:59-775(+)